MIEVSELSKKYGSRKVLQGVSAVFNKGHIYGLVGVNGSGKTTLMRCICGFARPDSGTVTVLGKRIGKEVDFAPSTGFIIETPGFLPHYSGLRNLMILAAISRRAAPEAVKGAIRQLGLDPHDKKPVGQYSLGMRQRLGLAQAIMEDPDVLILDEPFNGLDAEGNEDIHALLGTLRDKGKIILLASHSAYDIRKGCDTIYEVKEGKLTRRAATQGNDHEEP